MTVQHARAAQQRSIAAERQERVELLRRFERTVPRRRRQIRLEKKLEAESGSEAVQRLECPGQAGIAGMADHAQTDRSAGVSTSWPRNSAARRIPCVLRPMMYPCRGSGLN